MIEKIKKDVKKIDMYKNFDEVLDFMIKKKPS